MVVIRTQVGPKLMGSQVVKKRMTKEKKVSNHRLCLLHAIYIRINLSKEKRLIEHLASYHNNTNALYMTRIHEIENLNIYRL